ncbi:tetratricopeptide repeat protein [Seonamhaeicola maritimus]|uniref:Tetratricopeptide repeat protein n=1 Tax=Seonamhaeicola maritimus TaxID=2591822 RepID=A0A5C7GDP7_9FLAO|nr:hypothetical protein [Seonamhaeicola maritimus]TXG34512.1 hypothetical protein FUA22_18000 [Seonamhaeicola maritimus]
MQRILFFLIVIVVVSCKKDKKKIDYLGVVNLEVSGNENAIPHFEKGLLLLHSFEYEDAREAFLKAQEIDSTLAMAFWGEAMTFNHGLWRGQNYEEGYAAVQKIGELKETTNLTSLERDLLEAVELLYKPKTPKNERDQDYMKYMKALNSKYPDNHEVAAFYALSLLASASEGRNDSIYGLGADIAKKILKENAKHPGALHYLIHSYDDPDHAELALDAANSYSKVAPDASHALHMPSHIFVALGMWDRVIASNIDSYGASVNRMKAKELDNDARGYHAYHWLEYGYLQKEELEKAEKMVFDMQTYSRETPSRRARVHLLFLKSTFLAETDLWDHDIANIEIDDSGFNISLKAKKYFLEGMKAFKTNNKKQIDFVIDSLSAKIKGEALLMQNIESGFSVCASVNRSMPSESDIDESEVFKLQLMALRSWMHNDLKKANDLLAESVSLEDKLSYSYGPPSITKPTKELYAEFLLSQGRYEEAVQMYKGALKKGPKRLVPLKGIKKTALLLKDDALVKEVDLELNSI